jgi:hypothetical protein
MKNFTILLVFCLSCYSAFGQVTSLEEKRGFKKIRLGDRLEKWEQALSYKGKNDQGQVLYEYVGECCKELYDYKVDGIVVYIDEGSIVKIGCVIKDVTPISNGSYPFDPKVFDNLKDKLSYTIGEPDDISTNENKKIQITATWLDKNTVLNLTLIHKSIEISDNVYFVIKDRNYLEERAKEGF